jgi:hypothetical protein
MFFFAADITFPCMVHTPSSRHTVFFNVRLYCSWSFAIFLVLCLIKALYQLHKIGNTVIGNKMIVDVILLGLGAI